MALADVKWATPFESIHLPVQDLPSAFNRGSMIRKWIGILSKLNWKSPKEI